MKKKALRIVGTISATVLALAGCKEPTSGIVVLPENNDDQKEFEAHWKDINAALQGKEDLYYIKNFDRGNLVGEEGKLLDLFRVEEIKYAKIAPQFTGHAFQIGVGIKHAELNVHYVGDPKAVPTPSPTPRAKWSHLHLDWPHLHLNKKVDESAELVEKIDDVLKGATASPTPTPTPEP